MHFYGLPISLTMLTLLVLTSDYIRRTRSIPCLLMPRLPASPGHQRPLYWLCSIYRSLSLMREDFKYLCCVSFTKSSKIQRYFYISSNKFSTQKVKQLFWCSSVYHVFFIQCSWFVPQRSAIVTRSNITLMHTILQWQSQIGLNELRHEFIDESFPIALICVGTSAVLLLRHCQISNWCQKF